MFYAETTQVGFEGRRHVRSQKNIDWLNNVDVAVDLTLVIVVCFDFIQRLHTSLFGHLEV